jgi:glycerophosphoryl diester phosphodiesterase
MSERLRPAGRPITVCHRGASALAPENTLRAFELAIEGGVDMAELDVYLSADGELVVSHDEDLRRLTGRAVRVGELTAAELGRLDLGAGQGVPRLTEVFELARGRLGIYVELKGEGTGRALGELVRGGGAAGVDLIGGSFEQRLVAELREAEPTIPRCVLFRPTTLDGMLAVSRTLDLRYVHPCFRRADGRLDPPVDRPLVDALHAAGLMVMTNHTNDSAEAADFASIRVDVIASDDPRVLAQLKSRSA